MPLPIFVIGKHHLRCYLHIFTMPTVLKIGEKILLYFIAGTILVLKPSSERWEKVCDVPFDLKLFNATDDILLHITFSTTHIIFTNYAVRSLGDGQGKAQWVGRNFNPSVMYGDTVSIHHYLTANSEFGRYQILLNGKTVYHFDECLPGPATQISYTEDCYMGMFMCDPYSGRWGPSYWDVSVYQIGDLLPEDQLALGPER